MKRSWIKKQVMLSLLHPVGFAKRSHGIKRLTRVLLAAVIIVGQDYAADQWIRLKTDDFEMYTTHDKKRGLETLAAFEQVKSFFQTINPHKPLESPARIVAFRSEQEYLPYRIHDGAFAYYLHGPRHDYIVMQDIGPEHFQVAFHEYAHLAFEQDGARFPTWLNEGLADFYSSLDVSGGKIVAGRPLSGRLYVLRHQHWLDMATLLESSQDSPYYNDRKSIQLFYAQSWALAHMLLLSQEYRAGAKEFIERVSSGVQSTEAFKTVYNKTPDQIRRDLETYLDRPVLPLCTYDLQFKSQLNEVKEEYVDQFDAEFILADVLASNGSPATAAIAEMRLNALALQRPADPQVEESLGYLAWQQHRKEAALAHFRRAAALNSDDPVMLYHYATLAAEANAPESEVKAPLLKALALKPDFEKARFQLGLSAMRDGEYSMALANLNQVHQVKAENAFAFHQAITYCSFELDRLSEARRSAQIALNQSQTASEREQAEIMLEAIDRREKQRERVQASLRMPISSAPAKIQAATREAPHADIGEQTKRVDGTAKRLDCLGKRARLHMRVGSQVMIFDLPDPNSIVIRSLTGAAFSMVCGAQQPYRIGVVYAASARPHPGVIGDVRELYF